MSSSLSCRCGTLMVSDGVLWKCPLAGEWPEAHDHSVDDKRVGLFTEVGDLVPMLLRQLRKGRPGEPGKPGSRLRRQPWNQGKRRNGMRVQAKRTPSRREATLAAEWRVFIQSRERTAVKRFEDRRHHR